VNMPDDFESRVTESLQAMSGAFEPSPDLRARVDRRITARRRARFAAAGAIVVTVVMIGAAAALARQAGPSHPTGVVVTGPPMTAATVPPPTAATVPPHTAATVPPSTGVPVAAPVPGPMSFVDAQHGWVVAVARLQGAVSNLDVTTNGGHTWSLAANFSVGFTPKTLAFATRTDGYVGGDTLLVTHDGGRSFARSPLPAAPVALLTGPTEDFALTGACDANSCTYDLYATIDRGRTWVRRGILRNVAYAAGLVRDRDALALLTGDIYANPPHSQLFVSTDDGARWSSSPSPCGDGLSSTIASGPTDLWVECGSLQTGGFSYKQIYRSSDRKRWRLVADNSHEGTQPPHITGGGQGGVLAVADDTHAALGTYRGNLVVTQDGGITWTQARGLPTDAELFVAAVEFPDSQHGFASIEETTDSPDNGVYRTDDAGRTWTLVHIP
jgi:hypothetical protein